jgi:formylglycine-generating enzyme required for sulfatase activity
MRLALIPAGRLQMGSPLGEADGQDREQPRHEVEIRRPFYLGVYPVTQGQWQQLLGNNPSHFRPGGGGRDRVRGLDTSHFPVECVSWEGAVAFCRALSECPEERRANRVYRLPTEAEWEYACRGGGGTTPFHLGTSLSSAQANFNGDYPYGGAPKGPYLGRTSEVGAYGVSNAFGLYDLHGNVWEWCADWFDEGYYARSPSQDPQGPGRGSGYVARGGSWAVQGRHCRAAFRYWGPPHYRNNGFGFRVVAVPA